MKNAALNKSSSFSDKFGQLSNNFHESSSKVKKKKLNRKILDTIHKKFLESV